MAIDLQIKSGDTRDWRFAITDSADTAVNLTSARVKFTIRRNERDTTDYFVRDTKSTNSDFILISDAASGIVTVTPRAVDWVALSDNFGVYPAEFRISDSNNDYQFTQDITIDVQRPIIS